MNIYQDEEMINFVILCNKFCTNIYLFLKSEKMLRSSYKISLYLWYNICCLQWHFASGKLLLPFLYRQECALCKQQKFISLDKRKRGIVYGEASPVLIHDQSKRDLGVLLVVDRNLLEWIYVMVTFNLIWHGNSSRRASNSLHGKLTCSIFGVKKSTKTKQLAW
jgi:hypothetical protein